jgi:hypothetical protein
VLGDTIVVPEARPRAQFLTLTRIQVSESETGASRNSARYRAGSRANLLTIDTCPLDAFCQAFLVYAPWVFRVEGNSLFQQVPEGSPQLPYVLARIARR